MGGFGHLDRFGTPPWRVLRNFAQNNLAKCNFNRDLIRN